MKLLNKIRKCLFDRAVDDFESLDVSLRTSGARKPEPSASRTSKDLKSIEDWINERKKVIESLESFGIPCGSLKAKYYKRKVDAFHGLQGFKWEYSIEVGRSCDLDSLGILKKEMGYIEITKEELEATK